MLINMRWNRFLQPALIMSLGLLTLSTLWVGQRSLCINSKVVEKIDRISDEGTETVWRCGVSKAVPYSVWFSENLPRIEDQIQSMESVFEAIGYSDKKIQISILTDEPYLYRIQGNQLFIGEKLFLRDQVIPKTLAKTWFRSVTQNSLSDLPLIEEVVSDFLIGISQGATAFSDVKIIDPISGLRVSLDNVGWPNVLKTSRAYCRDGWLLSEHIEFCQKEYDKSDDGGNGLTDLSIRPLLLKIWIESYQGLNFSERYSFINNFKLFILKLSSERKKFDSQDVEGSLSPLAGTLNSIRSFNDFLKAIIFSKDNSDNKQFALNLFSKMNNLGMIDEQAEAKFDLLYETTGDLDSKRSIIYDLEQIAKDNPGKQIGIKDANHIWLLPSKTEIPLEAFGAIYSDKVVAEYCGDFSMSQILKYDGLADKLLLVVHCKNDKELSLAEYLKEGPHSFAVKNPKVSFVSLHVPSVVMKKKDLFEIKRFITLLRSDSIQKETVSKILGWQDVHWKAEEHAYAPSANIEGIQLFR